MIEVEELRAKVRESCRKRMLPCEQSDINQQIIKDHEIGFEAVLTGEGNEKILLPEDGNVTFLYRGQSQEYTPCFPTLYRQNPKPLTPCEIFIWRMKFMVFRDLLDSHPLVTNFFKRHNFKLDYEGLAQHYGLATSVLDLTSNFDIALFFAMTWYDEEHDCYHAFEDGEEREGILYVFCPVRDNEPTPVRIPEYMRTNITPIGLQPFLRPARQKGYALHIHPGKSTKSWAYRFKFFCEDSKEIFEKFNQGRDLWIDDPLAAKTKIIKRINTFSFKIFDRTFQEFRPKGYSKTRLKKELKQCGINLLKNIEAITFTSDERDSFIREWNEHIGKEFCDIIGRRPWHETDENINNGAKSFSVKVSKSHDYRTLKMIAEAELIKLLAYPDGPEGAEWINYMNTPNETHRPFTKKEQQWTKVPARMVNLFSKRYLNPEDYLI